MRIDGKPYRTIWLAADGRTVEVIDQTRLPHALEIRALGTLDDAVAAIRDMVVRGAPLIGATAAYGMALAMAADASDAMLARAYDRLMATRPTAVICAGRSTTCAACCRRCRSTNAPRRPTRAPRRSAPPMWRSARRSAGMGWRCSTPRKVAKIRVSASTC